MLFKGARARIFIAWLTSFTRTFSERNSYSWVITRRKPIQQVVVYTAFLPSLFIRNPDIYAFVSVN